MKKIRLIWIITLIVMIFNILFSPIVAYATSELEKKENIEDESTTQEQTQLGNELTEEETKEEKEPIQENEDKENDTNSQKNIEDKKEEEQKEEDKKEQPKEDEKSNPNAENEQNTQSENKEQTEENKKDIEQEQKEEEKKQIEDNLTQSEENLTRNEENVNDDKLTQIMEKSSSEIINTSIQENSVKTIANGTYTISTAMNSNLMLDVSGNSWNSGANISIWQKNNGNNQRFKVTYLSEGYYTLEVVSSGKFLTGKSEIAKNEDNVFQGTYAGKDNQKWIIKDAGNDYYYIISKTNSLYLDIYGAEPVNGANVQLYVGNNGLNQKFKFNKVSVPVGTKDVTEGIYTINTKMNFNRVIDIYGASYSNHANVELYTRNNNLNQKFKLEYDGEGYYKIIVEHSKKVLTVKSSSTDLGTNVEQYEDLGIDAQKWIIRSAGSGCYYIISKCNGLYLDLSGGSSNSGTNIEVYGANYNDWQKFKFFSTDVKAEKTISEGNYAITTSLNTNKAIDVEGDVISDNANIELWQKNEGNNQKFIVTYLSDGYYTIKAFNSNKVLTVKDSSKLSGANVVQSYYNGLDSQKWSIQYAENNNGSTYYYIVCKSNGLALDIEGATSKNGANIEVYEPNGGNNQKFQFVNTEFSYTILDGKYAIIASQNSKKVLDIEGGSISNGARVELWDSNGGSNQSFNIKYIGEGCYTIMATNSKKVLTVKNSNVVQETYSDLDTQKWIIQKADTNGNYAIRSKSTNKYLDIYNNDMYNGTKIEIFIGNESKAQRFKLEELVYKGIDVSKYQKNIDWKNVSTQIDFAMIRVGYRGYGSAGNIAEDEYYKRNMENALANNIMCGVYFFTQAVNEAEGIAEANWVLDKIKGYNITYPIAIDTEWANGDKSGRADWISNEDRTQAIKGFCKTIRNAGYTPIIYASKNWINEKLDISKLTEYDVWLAHYVTGAPDRKSDYLGIYSIWQYTSSGSIPGIDGNVDMDICYKKYL